MRAAAELMDAGAARRPDLPAALRAEHPGPAQADGRGRWSACRPTSTAVSSTRRSPARTSRAPPSGRNRGPGRFHDDRGRGRCGALVHRAEAGRHQAQPAQRLDTFHCAQVASAVRRGRAPGRGRRTLPDPLSESLPACLGGRSAGVGGVDGPDSPQSHGEHRDGHREIHSLSSLSQKWRSGPSGFSPEGAEERRRRFGGVRPGSPDRHFWDTVRTLCSPCLCDESRPLKTRKSARPHRCRCRSPGASASGSAPGARGRGR